MIDRLKSALTRKIGPLPAWGWLLILGAVVYYYRKRNAAASGTGTGSVGPAPATPQPGQVLEPGESYYDPNTGQLVTAPNAPGDTGNGQTGSPGTTTNPPATVGGDNRGNKPAWRAWWQKRYLRRHPKAWQKQWVKRHPKARDRSNATIRTHTGGRTNRRTGGGQAQTRSRTMQSGANRVTTRTRPKTPATRTLVRQHPAGSRQPSSSHKEATVNPRPSTRRSEGRTGGRRRSTRRGR